MTLPRVLIAATVRYRPDAPEVLPAFLDALAALDWPAERRDFLFIVQADQTMGETREALTGWHREHGGEYRVVDLMASADTRKLGGPRSTGETQENLAFLRNKILRRFQESDADLLLMVDSDVVLAPAALRRMVAELQERMEDGPATVTAQIDNRVAEDDEPASNGQQIVTTGPHWHQAPAEYATDGSVIEVARAGACTLYPKSVLVRRFRWDPRYNEEHQALFDDLRELGFRHYLIREPSLADHRMKRARPLREQLDAAVAKRDEARP